MKKTLVIILTLVFVLSLAGAAGAAPANPFVDVPAKHWAYDAVAKLAKTGIVDGYGDGTFRGDRTMTRYEMAQVVAKAMARSDRADAETKALIDKLAVEFAAELNNLGVRVAKLEEKTRIGWNFESRIRYAADNNKADSGKGTNAFDWRQRIYLHGDVNDNVSYVARLEAADAKFGATGSQNAGFNLAYFNVKNFLGAFDQFSVGRLDARGMTNGLLNGKDANNDGFKITKKLGEATFNMLFTDQGTNSEFALYNLDFKLSDSIKMNVGYETGSGSGVQWNTWPWNWKTSSWDVGTQIKIGNCYLTGEYVKTKIPDFSNTSYNAYAVQLTNGVSGYFYPVYNLVDPKKAHSDAFALSYRKIPEGSTPVMSGFRNIAPVFSGIQSTDYDVKGFFFTYQNVISKGVVWTVEYQDLKPVLYTSLSKPDKVWNTSFQFFF